MSQPNRKVLKELDLWVAEGLVGADQAARIRDWYDRRRDGPGWGVIVFAGIGAVIVGLGVILLFAYNWQAIPRGVKLLLVYGALAAAHGAGLWMFLRKPNLRALGEAVCLMGTMFFGAGIWLIAQIYHIDEHFPNAFFIWGLGALLLAFAMPSVAQGILAALLVTVWCGVEAFGFHAGMHAGPGIILILVGLLAWRERSRLLLGVAFPAFLISMVFVMTTCRGDAPELIVSTLLNTGVLLAGAAVLVRHSRSVPHFAPVFAFYGWAVFLVLLYVMTFPGAAEELFEIDLADAGPVALLYWGGSLALGLATWIRIAVRHAGGRRDAHARDVPWDHYLLPLTALIAALNVLVFGGTLDDWAAAGPFNLVMLAVMAGLITRGCRESELRPTVIGALLLFVYAFSRYVDLFESLLARGMVFIVVGAALFAQGVAYNRIRKGKDQARAGAGTRGEK